MILQLCGGGMNQVSPSPQSSDVQTSVPLAPNDSCLSSKLKSPRFADGGRKWRWQLIMRSGNRLEQCSARHTFQMLILYGLWLIMRDRQETATNSNHMRRYSLLWSTRSRVLLGECQCRLSNSSTRYGRSLSEAKPGELFPYQEFRHPGMMGILHGNSLCFESTLSS